MAVKISRRFRTAAVLAGTGLLSIVAAQGQTPSVDLWSEDNCTAWCAVLCDAKHRDSEARAGMLQRLGFKRFAYDWRAKEIPTFDAEIEALQKLHIDLAAWWFPLDTPEALGKSILETFRRHNVHPQLWMNEDRPRPGTPAQQKKRIKADALHIANWEKEAAPYGCPVELYNLGPWFGDVENELAVLGRLNELGVADVGMVYNFSHAQENGHDDAAHFADLWPRIGPHIVALNVTGMGGGMPYLSEGAQEIEMMRIIQDSHWRGPVGFPAEKGFGKLDAEVVLKNQIAGLRWLAVELKSPGSGGPKPRF